MTYDGSVKPLRGRVVVRPIVPDKYGTLHLPERFRDWTRDAQERQGIKAQSSHEGRVLALGPPARNAAGVEVPHGFSVGDVVVFVWHHNEKNFTHPWEDGGEGAWISQEEVLGVVDE